MISLENRIATILESNIRNESSFYILQLLNSIHTKIVLPLTGKIDIFPDNKKIHLLEQPRKFAPELYDINYVDRVYISDEDSNELLGLKIRTMLIRFINSGYETASISFRNIATNEYVRADKDGTPYITLVAKVRRK